MYLEHNKTTTSSRNKYRLMSTAGPVPSGQNNPVLFCGYYPVISGAVGLPGPSVNLGAAVWGAASVNLGLRVNLGCSV